MLEKHLILNNDITYTVSFFPLNDEYFAMDHGVYFLTIQKSQPVPSSLFLKQWHPL